MVVLLPFLFGLKFLYAWMLIVLNKITNTFVITFGLICSFLHVCGI